MLESGTDPESYITEYTLVYEDKIEHVSMRDLSLAGAAAGAAPAPQDRVEPAISTALFYYSTESSLR